MRMGVRLDCSHCGSIVVDAKDIMIFVRPPDGEHGRHEAFMSYNCTSCGERQNDNVCMCAVETVGPHCRKLVRITREHHNPAWPALTLDDMIDLHAELERL